jgi:hypothetical protein
MTSTRRAQAKVSVKASGVYYLLHFHERLGTEKHSIASAERSASGRAFGCEREAG